MISARSSSFGWIVRALIAILGLGVVVTAYLVMSVGHELRPEPNPFGSFGVEPDQGWPRRTASSELEAAINAELSRLPPNGWRSRLEAAGFKCEQRNYARTECKFLDSALLRERSMYAGFSEQTSVPDLGVRVEDNF